MNKENIIKKLIFAAKNVAFFGGARDDSDSLAAALALAGLVKKSGSATNIFAPEIPHRSLKFLDQNNVISQSLRTEKIIQIKVPNRDGQISGLTYKKNKGDLVIKLKAKSQLPRTDQIKVITKLETSTDLIVAIGVSRLKELGQNFVKHTELFYQVPIININYRADAEEFGKVNLLDLTVGSSSEQIFELINGWDSKLVDPETASRLLAGLLAKTESFQKKMTSPSQFDLAADLIEKGADRLGVIRELYKTKNLSKLKLWGAILSQLNSHKKGQIVWSVLDDNSINTDHIESADIVDLLSNYLSHSPATEVAAIFIITRQPGPRHRLDLRAYVATPGRVSALEFANKIAPAEGDTNLANFKLEIEQLADLIDKFKNIGDLFLHPRYNKRTKKDDFLSPKTQQAVSQQKPATAKTGGR